MDKLINKYGMAIAIPFLFIICFLTGFIYDYESPVRLTIITFALVLLCALAGICGFIKLRSRSEGLAYFAVVLAIGAIAFILKAEYIIYTPTWIRQHDVVGAGAGFGQAAFIEYFYEKIRLIDFDPRSIWGFFQPPLHHMLSGLYLRLWRMVGGLWDFSYYHCFENLQCLTLFYSCMISFIAGVILKKLGFERNSLAVGFMLVAIHPCFIQMAGSINNDILCILLQLLAVCFFLDWMKVEKSTDLIITAVFMGLSMMAKLSGVLLAPAIGFILLKRLGEKLRALRAASADVTCKKNLSTCIRDYFLFGIISIPLGVWSPVRNLVKFGVPLSYTPEVGESLSEYSLSERIFTLGSDISPFIHLKSNGADYDEYNIWFAILKTSIFGEADFSDTFRFNTFFGSVAVIAGLLLAIITMVLMVRSLMKKSSLNYDIVLFMNVYIIASVAFLIRLCITIPNFSSQDFRYIAHIILPQAVLIASFVKDSTEKNNENDGIKVKTVARFTEFLVVVFVVSAAVVYLTAGKVRW